MAKPTARCLLAIAVMNTFGARAEANDFTAGGTPSDLVPLEESRISMRSEDIVMEFRDGEWLVTADYVFVNSSNQAITQQIGFPELNCKPNQGHDCVPDAFKNLRTTVNDKPVTHTRGRISETHEWSKDLGTVWLFDATFGAAEPTRISHSYQVFTGSNLSWVYAIDYLVKTGRGWAGNIGSAKFRVKLPPAAHTVVVGDYPNPPKFVRDGGNRPYFVLERKNEDWVPPTSIGMAFVFTAWSEINERLGKDRFSRSGVSERDECTSPIAPETAAQAQMCRNLIYAISGYPFRSQKLQKYFYGAPFEWRRENDPSLGAVWVRGLRPFDDFVPAWIPALDRSILRHIDTLRFEERDGSEDLPSSSSPQPSEEDARADARLKAVLASPGKASPADVSSNTSEPIQALPPDPKPRSQAPSPSVRERRFCSSTPGAAGRESLISSFFAFVAAASWSRRRQARAVAPR